MTQAQLERAICRTTGETRDVVRRLGFQLINVPKVFIPRIRIAKMQPKEPAHGKPALAATCPV
jgi:hypothetical protein